MQILIYLFIGAISLVVNLLCFIGGTRAGLPLDYAIIASFIISAVLNKNKKQLFFIAGAGIVILIVFALYYYWWMSPVVGGMKRYWNTPLREAIKSIPRLFSSLPDNAGSPYVIYFVPFALLGILYLRNTKGRIVYSVTVSLVFVFLASFIGMWPMTGRLWLFLPAIIFAFTPAGFDFIRGIAKVKYKTRVTTVGLYLSSLATIILLVNCFRYTGDKMYYPGEEINPLIYYVQDTITKGERVYVFPQAKFAFDFKNGYAAKKIGNGDENNIIYGHNGLEWRRNSIGAELKMILEHKKVYLIFQHHTRMANINRGLETLRKYGTVTEIMNVHGTPLYYFERAQ